MPEKKLPKTNKKGIVIEDGKCFFCGRRVKAERFCYGCKEYVCASCEQNEPMGDHDVEDHRESSEDDW